MHSRRLTILYASNCHFSLLTAKETLQRTQLRIKHFYGSCLKYYEISHFDSSMNVFAQKKCVICHIDVKWIHLKNPYLYENKNVFDNDDSCSITINLDHYFMI